MTQLLERNLNSIAKRATGSGDGWKSHECLFAGWVGKPPANKNKECLRVPEVFVRRIPCQGQGLKLVALGLVFVGFCFHRRFFCSWSGILARCPIPRLSRQTNFRSLSVSPSPQAAAVRQLLCVPHE